MKRILFLCLLIVCFSSAAVSKDEPTKAMLNVITYAPDGTLLRSGYGFFVSAEGYAVASYSLFKGAARAVVIDTKGKEMSVSRISGANSTHDLVKFLVSPAKKVTSLSLSKNGTEEDSELKMVYYTTNKKDQPLSSKVVSATSYDGYKYYDLNTPNTDKYFGSALLDANDAVVGIVQKNVLDKAETACAIDARFVEDMTINSVSALNSDLRNIFIPKVIPANEQEALAYIYMLGRSDSMAVVTAMADFIATYPQNVDVLVERAAFYASRADYAAAEDDYRTALQICEKNNWQAKAAEVHYNYSKTIFVHSSLPRAKESWSIERALDEARMACEADTHALYRVQRADCYLAARKYSEAHTDYKSLAEGWMSTPEMYFRAARSLELSGGDSLQVITLLDSMVNRLPRPLNAASARYLLERAYRLMDVGQYRTAVFDMNDYEKAIGPNRLTSQFYYLRHRAELSARMYQQALDDIRRAVQLAPHEVTYRLEEAHLLLRVGLYEDAYAAAKAAQDLAPEDPVVLQLLEMTKREQ